MTSLLCFVCQSIFRGKKIEHSRGKGHYHYTPHHQSLDSLHSGASVGCVLCEQLACHLASKVNALENLEWLKSGRLLYDYDRPGQIEFRFQFKERNAKDHRFGHFFRFGVVPLSSEDSKKCQLIETNCVSVSGAYITLSHRWDFSDFLKLESETMKSLKDGQLICDLPATFRDAIFVAQQLDCREDWVKESPTMRHVYGFATLNIVAGHSRGPGDGLFNTRESSKLDSIIVRSNWDDNTNADYLLWDKPALDGDFEFAPLTKRGWVFQERLLAPRILQFGKKQVYWKCSQLFACEMWPQGVRSFEGNLLRFGADLDGLDGNGRMEIPSLEDSTEIPIIFLSKGPVAHWERLVSEYSRTELTRSEDRLVALSGVAKLFQQTFADDYLAGLWRTPLERLLCWCRDEEKEQDPRERPEYRAPSWSWASIDGPICFTTTTREDKLHWLEYVVRVLDAQVTPLDGDKMAQVKSGYVKVEGRLRSLRVISGKLENGSNYHGTEFVGVEVGGTEISDFYSLIDTEPDCELNGLLLWVMPTLVVVETAIELVLQISIEGLMLRKRSEQGVESDTYERVGYFIHTCEYGSQFEGAFGIYVKPDDNEPDVEKAQSYSLEFDPTIQSWEVVTIV
ncbi:HET domain-containing protein [Fusarium sp. LHS14.1]|nr:HET domain-containing protein [Fusarium sp. LHS14.1]